MKKSIACIGNGFVGGSLTTVMAEKGFDVFVFDKSGKVAFGGQKPFMYHGMGLETMPEPLFPENLEQFVKACELYEEFTGTYFVCVPTPMKRDGSCDTSIVEGILQEISTIPGKRIAVVKSTVTPGSTEEWNRKFERTGLRVVFCPEFLTEANALDDMRNQNRIVLGGPRPHINSVKQVFQTAFPNIPIVKTSSTTAEMVKYFTNVHLAARVVLSCELFQVCEALEKSGLNVDYDKVKEYASYDVRLGGTHMNVPGAGGVAGARGHCFPKDLNAMISVARSVGIDPKMMTAIWEKNLEIVPEEQRDWERMIGRAVSRKRD